MEGSIEFNRAAFKHGATEKDIRYAFEHWLLDQPVVGEDGKHLLIGFDRNANLLEILYNVIEDQRINVFHAMKCRPAWRRLAERGA
ncbi:MAG: hypothetical protein LBG87_06520 [Spirochaetaceae bacterium]|jgi:hypothetical protein|nr:hypothetical protein [Spirochaetaceae bacterium]